MNYREKMIHKLIVDHEEKVSDLDDEALFDDLEELRDQRIEAIIDAVAEELATESNEKLFGDEWDEIRQSAIDGFVESRLDQLQAFSDEELQEMVAVISTNNYALSELAAAMGPVDE